MSFPAKTVATGEIERIKVSSSAGQEPAGMSVVIIKSTVPFIISLTPGVYEVFGFIAEEKVPSPEVVQLIEEALPLNEALIMLRRSPSHIVVSLPALTNAAGSIVSKKLSTAAEQKAEGAFVVAVMVAEPFAISPAPGV